MRNFRRAGFSLVEVTISAAILLVLFFIAYALLFHSDQAATRGMAVGAIDLRGQLATDELKREFLFGRVKAMDGAGHSWIELQHPIDDDLVDTVDPADEDIVDAAGRVEYGVLHPQVTDSSIAPLPILGWYCRFTFTPSQILREPNGFSFTYSGASNADVECDLNKDGDLDDTLVVGTLMREYYDDAGNLQAEITFSDQVVTAPGATVDAFDGDVNGDGQDDPLFRVVNINDQDVAPGANARVLKISLWHGVLDPNGREFHLRNNQERIHFRNPQQ